MVHDERLLTSKEAAEILGIKANTLNTWRLISKDDRRCIPYVKIGRAVRYRLSDLKNYLYKQTK
jgi:excisionase family DNA binding protein